jgi:hypothetical protein
MILERIGVELRVVQAGMGGGLCPPPWKSAALGAADQW